MDRDKINLMPTINLPYYRKQDWERLLSVSDDRESMHDTWNAWHKVYQKLKKQMIARGFEVREVVVDIDELVEYCKSRGIKNDSHARSQFVVDKD